MAKHFIYPLLFTLIMASQPRLNTGLAVSGAVVFKGVTKPGELRMALVDEETFRRPFDGNQKLQIPVGDKELKTGTAAFCFKGLLPGRYGIRCFVDHDGNKELTIGIFGPSEPWGMSFIKKKPIGMPKFRHIVFDVYSPVKNLRIVVD